MIVLYILTGIVTIAIAGIIIRTIGYGTCKLWENTHKKTYRREDCFFDSEFELSLWCVGLVVVFIFVCSYGIGHWIFTSI